MLTCQVVPSAKLETVTNDKKQDDEQSMVVDHDKILSRTANAFRGRSTTARWGWSVVIAHRSTLSGSSGELNRQALAHKVSAVQLCNSIFGVPRVAVFDKGKAGEHADWKRSRSSTFFCQTHHKRGCTHLLRHVQFWQSSLQGRRAEHLGLRLQHLTPAPHQSVLS